MVIALFLSSLSLLVFCLAVLFVMESVVIQGLMFTSVPSSSASLFLLFWDSLVQCIYIFHYVFMIDLHFNPF